jgi:hypothetical protein
MAQFIELLTQNKIVKIVLIIILFIFVMYLVGYFIVMKGEPFDVAKQFIYDHKLISAELGPIKNIKLSMLSSIRISGTYGTARFKLFVDGEKSKGIVYADLEKQAGIWVVVHANMIRADNSKINLK